MRWVEWAPSAQLDLDQITSYVGADNPHAARRIGDSIVAAVEKLAFMATGRAGRIDGTYERPVRGLPYIIAFDLPDEDTLRVLRIIHGARDWRAGEWPS